MLVSGIPFASIYNRQISLDTNREKKSHMLDDVEVNPPKVLVFAAAMSK
jgi:hypothetical protein